MIRKLSLGVLVAALAAACGSVRLVEQTQYGGTFALEGDRNKAMEAAAREMARHCGPNNFTIVRQGEVPIGTDSAHREDTYANNDGTVTQASGQVAVRFRLGLAHLHLVGFAPIGGHRLGELYIALQLADHRAVGLGLGQGAKAALAGDGDVILRVHNRQHGWWL